MTDMYANWTGPMFTVSEMLDQRPCAEYDEDRLTRLWAGRERLGWPEFVRLRIHVQDKLWVAAIALPPEINARRIELTVSRAIRNYVVHCGIESVEQWGRGWLSGKDMTRAAARDASWAAADAAYRAAWAAAQATEAAAGAAWVAELRLQLRDIRRAIREASES